MLLRSNRELEFAGQTASLKFGRKENTENHNFPGAEEATRARHLNCN